MSSVQTLSIQELLDELQSLCWIYRRVTCPQREMWYQQQILLIIETLKDTFRRHYELTYLINEINQRESESDTEPMPHHDVGNGIDPQKQQ